MNTNEKTLWSLFKGHLPKGSDFQRIETGSTGRGIPDVNLCYEGRECWVELKIVMGKRIEVRPEQVAWHFRRNRAGGVTWILARDKYDSPRKGKADLLLLWRGAQARQLAENGVAVPTVATWHKPFDWASIMETILGG